MRTRNEIIKETTEHYISSIKGQDPETIERDILQLIRQQIDVYNATLSKGEQKYRAPDELYPIQIAQLMIATHHVIRLPGAGSNQDPETDLIAVYNPDEGIYETFNTSLRILARQFNYNLKNRDFDEIITALRDQAPRKERTMNKDLIAVNNGIFDYKNKKLLPFSPDYIFTSKSHVDYNPNATNKTIVNKDDGTSWDVESWMQSLSDDPEIVQLLWEILSAIIRPYVSWNKMAWLYSEEGNNGKGTLCTLMRNLCGEQSVASIPVNDFGKDFMLEPLTRANAVIVDENDVGTFVDKAANLKAVVTNDIISINKKYKTPVNYRFYGFMVQCLNEFPRVRDRSDSFYRRQLFIPMDKSFKGIERKYIKDDYLYREEVLEYVLYKCLHSNFYNLSEPRSCTNVLGEYQEFNNPIQEFLFEFEDEFVWDLLPYTFLFDLYKEWFKKTNPSGTPVGRNIFTKEIRHISKKSKIWTVPRDNIKVWAKDKMATPEHLIVEYNLKDWKNPKYTGDDQDKISLPELKDNYRGLVRIESENTNETN